MDLIHILLHLGEAKSEFWKNWIIFICSLVFCLCFSCFVFGFLLSIMKQDDSLGGRTVYWKCFTFRSQRLSLLLHHARCAFGAPDDLNRQFQIELYLCKCTLRTLRRNKPGGFGFILTQQSAQLQEGKKPMQRAQTASAGNALGPLGFGGRMSCLAGRPHNLALPLPGWHISTSTPGQLLGFQV